MHLRPLACGLLLGLGGCELLAPLGVGSQDAAPSHGIRLDFAARQPIEFFTSSPVTDGTRLFLEAFNFTLVAVDRRDGKHLWTVHSPEGEVLGSPTYHEGRVLTASAKARAWDAATGALLWEAPLTIGSPRHRNAAAGGLFFAGLDSVIVAFDVATGERRWESVVGPGWAYTGRVSALSVADGTVYACLREPLEWNGWRTVGHVVAVDAATGIERWRYRMSFETVWNFCMGEPVPAGDMLIVADAGGNNYVGLDRSTGEFRWRYIGDRGWAGPFAAPTVIADTVFAASFDRQVVKLHRRTGTVFWQSMTDGSSARHAAPCGRVIIVPTTGSTNVLDRRTGRVLTGNLSDVWEPHAPLSTRVIVAGDTAFAFGGWNLYRMRCPR